jgi:lysophospholipase L1-like esterase
VQGALTEPCRKGLVAVGDSISVGEGSMALGVTPLSWAQWLARALDLPFTCYAINGATAADMLREQLPRVRADYDVATLYAGVNDVRSPDWNAAAYEHDLDALAAGLAARAARLLLLTLPHDLGRPTCAPKPQEANAAVRRVAQRHRAALADLADFGGWTLVLPDVVHPTALGQLEIADRAAGALGSPALPSALVETPRGTPLRYVPAHAQALVRQLAHRVHERVARP